MPRSTCSLLKRNPCGTHAREFFSAGMSVQRVGASQVPGDLTEGLACLPRFVKATEVVGQERVRRAIMRTRRSPGARSPEDTK